MSKIKLDDWQGVVDGRWKRKRDISLLDDPIERKLAERLQLCYVEGKKKNNGKNALVPIIFTNEMMDGITVLVENRRLTGIKDDNLFVLATGGDFCLRGWDTLQGITKQISGLKEPKLITPTRTRKFLSTLLQLMDMTDAELTWVTNHLGHTKNTHLAWYRKVK